MGFYNNYRSVRPISQDHSKGTVLESMVVSENWVRKWVFSLYRFSPHKYWAHPTDGLFSIFRNEVTVLQSKLKIDVIKISFPIAIFFKFQIIQCVSLLGGGGMGGGYIFVFSK